jgi:DNA-binding transcriptional MerR regulator
VAERARRAAVGPLFCIIDGATRGRPWAAAAVRSEFRRVAARAGVRRRFAPHQLRHAHALELAREGVPLNIIQRQLWHTNLGTTSIYLQGIDPEEIITAVRTRRAPSRFGGGERDPGRDLRAQAVAEDREVEQRLGEAGLRRAVGQRDREPVARAREAGVDHVPDPRRMLVGQVGRCD